MMRIVGANKRLQPTGISVPLIDNLLVTQLSPVAEAQRSVRGYELEDSCSHPSGMSLSENLMQSVVVRLLIQSVQLSRRNSNVRYTNHEEDGSAARVPI